MVKSRNNSVRVGRTIAQEWEKQESESERLAARKKAKVKKTSSVVIVAVILVVIAVLVVISVRNYFNSGKTEEVATAEERLKAEVVDENGVGVTKKIMTFLVQAEGDFKEKGITMTRAVVPAGKTREVHVFLEEFSGYVKLNVDRGAAESVEDTERMIRYCEENGVSPEYIDVRVEGKGYYK